MKTTHRAALVAALITLTGIAVSGNASASVDDAVQFENDMFALNGPHDCTEVSPGYYSCYGVHGTCVVYWYDDDANGNPYDKNARITKNTCALSNAVKVQTVLVETA